MKITEIISVLDSLGAAPRKSLGQNFLHDKNLARWIVEKLEIKSGDHIVEIGPGLGALTQEIVQYGVSATLLEKDRAFVKYLRERFEGPNIEVIEGDALEYGWENTSPSELASALRNPRRAIRFENDEPKLEGDDPQKAFSTKQMSEILIHCIVVGPVREPLEAVEGLD